MSLLEEYKNQASWRDWESYIVSLPVQQKDIILDIGCGIGSVSKILSEKSSKVFAIDNNLELLNESMKNSFAENISYCLMDAYSLTKNAIPMADGIWTSFLPAYFPDFDPVLKNWLKFLKPNGWLAIVEMSDLFGHDPLSGSTHEIFKNYYLRQVRKNLYDFEMGSKLHSYLTKNGLSIIHEENKNDPELTFNGAATSEIFSAWKARFDRMSMFRKFVGEIKFINIKEEFLSCIANKDHFSRTIVKFIIAIK